MQKFTYIKNLTVYNTLVKQLRPWATDQSTKNALKLSVILLLLSVYMAISPESYFSCLTNDDNIVTAAIVCTGGKRVEGLVFSLRTFRPLTERERTKITMKEYAVSGCSITAVLYFEFTNGKSYSNLAALYCDIAYLASKGIMFKIIPVPDISIELIPILNNKFSYYKASTWYNGYTIAAWIAQPGLSAEGHILLMNSILPHTKELKPTLLDYIPSDTPPPGPNWYLMTLFLIIVGLGIYAGGVSLPKILLPPSNHEVILLLLPIFSPKSNFVQSAYQKYKKHNSVTNVAITLKNINRIKREQRLNKTKTHWNRFGVTMTLKRRNTFINLGYTEYASRQRRQQGRVLTKNSRGRFTQTLTYVSAGNCGLKGSKKAAPMANITIGELAATRFKKFGHNQLRGRFLGSGRRRKEIIKGLINGGLMLHALKQDTKRAHNGPRHKKPRRK
jgi:ribosomal protein S11